MKVKFREFLNEAGASAGTHEIVKTSFESAYEHAKKAFKKKGLDVDKEIPDLEKNYELAKTKAKQGRTLRKDMPVIEDKDIKLFQSRLKTGKLDINNPYGDVTDKNKIFPQHTKGQKSKDFIEAGKHRHDKDRNDDKVDVSKEKVAVKDLAPIQKQIYFDKSVSGLASFGAAGSRRFLATTTFIVSKDNRIIDGHHRYLSAMIVDPKLKVNVIKIDLPIRDLLKLSLAYGDAIGNKRNA